MYPNSLLAILLLMFLIQHTRADCKTVACGNLTVKYPFWLGAPSQPPPELSCGQPAFELLCTGNGSSSTASLRGSAIRVLSIDYAANSFVASHGRVAVGNDGVCHTNFNMSSSLSLSPFKISPSNRAMCFLYNYNGTEPRGRGYMNVTAGCGRSILAYLAGSYDRDRPPAIPAGSCTFAYLPVLRSEAETMTAANYSRLLKSGFILERSATSVGDCSACIASGGQCRYINESAAFACFCPSSRKMGQRALVSLQTLAPVKLKFRNLADNLKTSSLSVIISVIFAFLVWGMYSQKQKLSLFIFPKQTSNKSSMEEMLRRYGPLAPKRYRYSDLKKMTSSFKNKLGEGGYGTVYRGSLRDGCVVAVKLLQGSKGNVEEFLNEVISICRTSHVNIVSLLGFCLEGPKRALVYEYMANGLLDKYIYLESSDLVVGWEKLQQIAVGIARGLEYLHQGCSTRIIHFDIKPQNILVDEDFCPKIA
ncbi:hypothetical protein ACQ4PT_011259 [Festuca glaucescens]